jgi:parallel beta-helix repeat protein
MIVLASELHVGSGQTYLTISAAVTAANPGDVIIVHDGTYTENVNVTKRLTIKSKNGYTSTKVVADNPHDHVFEVNANNVTIGGIGCGFSIYGANGNYMAGIYLGSSITGCTIQDNRCGWDNTHNNYYGIYLCSSSNNTLTGNTASSNYYGIYLYSSCNANTLTGNTVSSNYSGIFLDSSCNANTLTGNTASSNYYGIYLHSSSNNTLTGNNASSNDYCGIYLESSSNSTLTGNTASSNDYCGIYLSSSSNSTLTGNTASSNDCGIFLNESGNNTLTGNTASFNAEYGIYLYYSCNANTLTGNTASSNYYGIYLYYLNNANTLTGNTANNNGNYGIYLWYSSNNTIYLNNLSGNTSGNAYVENVSDNIWRSPTTIYYDYNGGSFHKNYLGNYYGNYSGSDADGDGIGNTAYSGTGMTDNYPLMDTSACYLLQAWWLSGDSTMYKDDRSKAPGSVTITNGGSHIWIADQAALININVPGTDSWTGQIAFTSAPANGHSFKVEIGYWNGTNFIAGGPDATLTGNGSKTVFTYTTDASAFTVNTGNYLALRITNNSTLSYAVQTGGAWSYCSSPNSSKNYLVSVENNSMTENVPKEYALHQNYPNPFNPVTKISYEIPVKSQVTLKVYDMLGREVAKLYEGEREAGRYEAEFNGMRFSSGVYFYKLEAGGYTAVKKLILVK